MRRQLGSRRHAGGCAVIAAAVTVTIVTLGLVVVAAAVVVIVIAHISIGAARGGRRTLEKPTHMVRRESCGQLLMHLRGQLKLGVLQRAQMHIHRVRGDSWR